jgi:uncharacterized integral membrane protein
MAEHEEVEESGDSPVARRRDLQLVVLGVAALALAWFAVGNLGSVSIDFWVRHSRAPLILVILMSGVLGGLIATVAMWRRGPRR